MVLQDFLLKDIQNYNSGIWKGKLILKVSELTNLFSAWISRILGVYTTKSILKSHLRSKTYNAPNQQKIREKE